MPALFLPVLLQGLGLRRPGEAVALWLSGSLHRREGVTEPLASGHRRSLGVRCVPVSVPDGDVDRVVSH